MPYFLILFIVMPIVEIALLLRVGDAFGWLPTLLVVIVTAIIGSAMLRQQGLVTLNRARQRMDNGELPAMQLLEGLLIMIGGVLLLTPGFVTDTFGFLCLIPITREWLARYISSSAAIRVSGMGGAADVRASQQQSAGARSGSSARSAGKNGGDVIDGDFERIDE